MSIARLAIARLTDDAAWPQVDGLVREYLRWAATSFEAAHGVRVDDIEQQHAGFAAERPDLTSGRGRLLLAQLDGQPVGVVALQPASQSTATVKRMYVRPAARGRGIGRKLLGRLIDDARAEGFRFLRLESVDFMTEALAMYRSLGFVDVAPFDGSQLAAVGPTGGVRCMALDLGSAPPG